MQVEYIADQLDLDPLDPMYRTFSKIFQARLCSLFIVWCPLKFLLYLMMMAEKIAVFYSFSQAFKIVDPEDEKKMVEEEVIFFTI